MGLTEVGWGCRLDLSVSEQGLVTSVCEDGNELSDSIKQEKLFDCLGNYQLLNRDSVPSSQATY